jgi:hypothetical protein
LIAALQRQEFAGGDEKIAVALAAAGTLTDIVPGTDFFLTALIRDSMR